MGAHMIHDNSIPFVRRGNERVPEIIQKFFTGRSAAVNRMGSLTVAFYGGKNRGIGRRIQESLVYEGYQFYTSLCGKNCFQKYFKNPVRFFEMRSLIREEVRKWQVPKMNLRKSI